MLDYEALLNNDDRQGIEKTISKKLKEKVVQHRARFISLMKARYLEMLPSLIKYSGTKDISIDFHKVEVALRNNYHVVIGWTKEDNLQVIGWMKSHKSTGNPADLWSRKPMTKNDIKMIIPERLQCDTYQEITHLDNCESGNFVVLRNKTLNYVDDLVLINHYIDELAEINLSRFSIAMQVKISTIFLGEPNDVSTQNLMSDLYNGNPMIEGSKLFDPEDQIYHMKNEGIAQNFAELKREYQNKMSELNNNIGIHSLAVEKSSGVSDAEAKSNRAYTTGASNIYLDGRNHGLNKLNKRYGTKLSALYNDEVLSEFQELAKEEEKNEQNNNHSV